jgi:hypothetical protein
MRECIICRKMVSTDRELCEEHRNILKTISNAYNQDPEMHRRWDNILELVESKNYNITDSYIDEVLNFIYEIKTESAKK